MVGMGKKDKERYAEIERQRALKERAAEYVRKKHEIDMGGRRPFTIPELMYFGVYPRSADYVDTRPDSLDSESGVVPYTPRPPAADTITPSPSPAVAEVPDDLPDDDGPMPGPYTRTSPGELNAATVERIIAAVPSNRPRHRMAVLLMADVGLGMADIARVGPSTVDVKRGVLHVSEGDVPVKKISPRTWTALCGYVQSGGDLAMGNVTYYRIVRAAAELAGVNATAAQLIRYGKKYRVERTRKAPRTSAATG